MGRFASRFALSLAMACSLRAQPPSPSAHLGITVGADRTLADFGQMTRYFKALAAASPRVRLQVLGPSTQGRELFMAVISSPGNLAELDRIKATSRRLADPRGLSPKEVEELARTGKMVLLVTCSLHASEIGATQFSMEWAHALASTQDPAQLRWLEEVVLLLVPSLNPDGHEIELDWYRKQLGTPYEGGMPPWPYHPHAGHDNNRDWFMLNLPETRAVNRMAYLEWFPQVWLDMHQMMENGARMFVPPYTNPASPRIPALAHRATDLLGTLMGMRLEEAGKAGVGYGFAFDVYWPGSSSETGYWKNTIGLLTELASCRLATPVKVEPTELEGGMKGLSEYKVQVNFPNPWKGGTWRLRDIMDYERIACDALLEGCAQNREHLLRNRARMAMEAVSLAPEGTGYRIPMSPGAQRDRVAAFNLARLLQENGAEVRAEADGSFWVPANQPLGRFLAEMLEVQRYPEVRPLPGAPILPPYDVTAWSLPLLMGVEVAKERRDPRLLQGFRLLADSDGPQGRVEAGEGKHLALEPVGNESVKLVNEALAKGLALRVATAPFTAGGRSFPSGTVLLPAGKSAEGLAGTHRQLLTPLAQPPQGTANLRMPRIGLYRPWWIGAEEGWTRLVLERHGFKPVVLEPRQVQKGKLRSAFEVIVVPTLDKPLLMEGKPGAEDLEGWYWEDFPPEYRGGIGKEGAAALRSFIEEGGTVVLMGAACQLAVDEWNLPLRNPIAKLKPTEFQAPGPMLRARRLAEHPVTWGIPEHFTVIPDGPMLLQTLMGPGTVGRTVLSDYPAEVQDLLASGWIKGGEKLAGKANAAAFTLGKGRLVLLAFQPVFRAQSQATFRFLFNAIHWAGME